MSFGEASSDNEIGFDQDPPLVKKNTLRPIVELWNDGKLKSTTFYHVKDKEVFFGYKSRNKREITIAKFSLPLRRVQDK